MPEQSGSCGDLEREYQAIIAYVRYSRAMKGTDDASVTNEVRERSDGDSQHDLIISRQIDYLGGYPPVAEKPGV